MDNLFKIIWTLVLVHQIVVKDSFLKSMLSEPGPENGISSKRCISISCTATFIYICYWSTVNSKTPDGNIIFALVTTILTSATIATIPQLVQLFGVIKSVVIPKLDPTVEGPKTVVNIDNK